MNTKFSNVFGVLILLFSVNQISAATDLMPVGLTPIGYWKTIDDKTSQVLSIVQIYAEKDGSLSGKVVTIMPVLGQQKTDVCQACKDQLHNKPILGMEIIWGMKHDMPMSDTWIDGHVLDPKSGSVYSGKMTVLNNGQQLKLRGYVLMPLLGRSEIWQRTELSSGT
ncbi:MAG: DUF2147 domain-containing protein [Gammaproteobacteria bacterium]|nr:DUF2147 domain-containing protein [Gammaproteobacteria bacterium]